MRFFSSGTPTPGLTWVKLGPEHPHKSMTAISRRVFTYNISRKMDSHNKWPLGNCNVKLFRYLFGFFGRAIGHSETRFFSQTITASALKKAISAARENCSRVGSASGLSITKGIQRSIPICTCTRAR